ncbi:hypothetical protein GXW82_37405 [Streptacidiphilus sp. 4-A2]|nr:hypothetical protein [Streptacidiphilus sp. 4-A2]
MDRPRLPRRPAGHPPAAAGAGGRRGRRPAVPAGPVQLLPTTRYDGWQTSPPADRLVPVLCAWAVVPRYSPGGRTARRPRWHWSPHGTRRPCRCAGRCWRRWPCCRRAGVWARPPAGGTRLRELVGLVHWLGPGLVGTEPADAERILATLREAELLARSRTAG